MRKHPQRFVYWSIRGLDAYLELEHAFDPLPPNCGIGLTEPEETNAATAIAPYIEHTVLNDQRLESLGIEAEEYKREGRNTISAFYGDRLAFDRVDHILASTLSKTILTHYRNWEGRTINEDEIVDHEFGIHHDTYLLCRRGKGSGQIANTMRVHFHPPDFGIRLRWFMKDRMIAATMPMCSPYNMVHQNKLDNRERRALVLLRDLLNPKQFKQYLRKGFLNVRAESGKVYRLGSDQSHMPVYENNKQTHLTCIVPENNGYCPTDIFMMRYILLVSDEDEFNRIANRHELGNSLFNALHTHGGNRQSRLEGWKVDIRRLPEVMTAIKKRPRMKMFEPFGDEVDLEEQQMPMPDPIVLHRIEEQIRAIPEVTEELLETIRQNGREIRAETFEGATT